MLACDLGRTYSWTADMMADMVGRVAELAL